MFVLQAYVYTTALYIACTWPDSLYNALSFFSPPPLSFTLSLPFLLQELMTFLQNLPTSSWTDDDVQILLSEAFKLKQMLQDTYNISREPLSHLVIR